MHLLIIIKIIKDACIKISWTCYTGPIHLNCATFQVIHLLPQYRMILNYLYILEKDSTVSTMTRLRAG